MKTDEGFREIEYTEKPNGTHAQFLVMYPGGGVTCNVHQMINRVVADPDLPKDHQYTAIMLIVNDGETPVWVSVEDISDDQGLEWQIAQPRSEECAVYVLYNDDERQDTHTYEVRIAGFPEEPSYPELVEEPV